jgi:hypothetical protein
MKNVNQIIEELSVSVLLFIIFLVENEEILSSYR